MEPQIQFCTTSDGVRIAYAVLGVDVGTPLISVNSWSFDITGNWDFPNKREWDEELAKMRWHVLLDRRGAGSSQREVTDISPEAAVADLAAVVDQLHLEQFDLFGVYDGAAAAIAYAAQNPERVRRLVLWGPFVRGEEAVPEARSLAELIRGNWRLARRALAEIAFPSGPPDVQRLYYRFLESSVSQEVAARYVEMFASIDLTPFLSRVQAPTLVLHRRGDRSVPSRAGRDVAELITNARFIALEGESALISDVAGDLDIITKFLDEGAIAPAAAPSGLVTILFTDMESSTTLTQQLGDAKAQEVRRTHNTIVRTALGEHAGREIKHTGDGIMASFPTASSALGCAIAIQHGVAKHKEEQPDSPLAVYIGLNAGEPIAEDDDLYGTSVNLAARICDHAEPGQIVAADVVRQLAAGKQFLFSDLGETELRGFEDPIKLWEVRWREEG